jgi:Ca-activated chloride channel family protein
MRFIGREPGGGSGFISGGGGGRFRRGIDEDTLVAVAELTGGRYYPAESADELGEVFDALPTSEIRDHRVEEVSFAFVGLGAILAAMAILLGRAWRPLP